VSQVHQPAWDPTIVFAYHQPLTFGPAYGGNKEHAKELTLEDFEAIQQLPHVKIATTGFALFPPRNSGPATYEVKYNGRKVRNTILEGDTGTWGRTCSIWTSRLGAGMNEIDEEHHSPVIVLGSDTGRGAVPECKPSGQGGSRLMVSCSP